MARRPTRSGSSGRKASKSRSAAASRSGARKSPAKRKGGARSASRSSRASAARASRQSKEPKDLGDLFMELLKDIYHAEKQILRALPKMAKAAQSEELRQAFENHRHETEGQVQRLERIFELSGQRPKAKPCHAILGLVEEGDEVMKDFKGSEALDAGLLAGAQAVEHYEISRYGTMRAWALQHGMHEVAELLRQTLEEEKQADQLLTQIAESSVNLEAEAA